MGTSNITESKSIGWKLLGMSDYVTFGVGTITIILDCNSISSFYIFIEVFIKLDNGYLMTPQL